MLVKANNAGNQMTELQFSQQACEFIRQPGPASALGVINSLKGMIINLAAAWRLKGASQADKMREIMSEMLLILLEDFSPERVANSSSIASYLKMKLKRLTHPGAQRETPFGGAFDMGELGRCNFSGLRLQLAEEICATVRRCLLGYSDPTTCLLEFLFIHVYPEINWASRLIAQKTGIDELTAANADKKRHSRFNNILRTELQNLNSGELHDIADWSGGERSHLAWKIIGITQKEIEEDQSDSLATFDKWRETIDRRQPQPIQMLATAEQLLNSMKQRFRQQQFTLLAAEEAEPYGETPDILLQLIGRCKEVSGVGDDTTQWQTDNTAETTVSDQEFSAVAGEVCQWLEKLVSELHKPSRPKKKSSDYSSY